MAKRYERWLGWPNRHSGEWTHTYVFGLKVAPKVSIIILHLELGKPYMFPLGSKVARPHNDIDGRGCDKKRKPVCNAQNRGFMS